MERFLEKQDKANAEITQKIESLTNHNKDLEDNVSKMAKELSSITRGKGKFLGQPEENPRETCKCITLRSGTAYKGPPMPDQTSDEMHAEPSQSEEYEPQPPEPPVFKLQTDLTKEQNDTVGGEER